MARVSKSFNRRILIMYYFYIFRITYCPRFSSLFPNWFNWRIIIILVITYLVTLCSCTICTIKWRCSHFVNIFWIIYCPRFSSLFPNSFDWRMFTNLDSVILEAVPKILWEIIIYYFYIFRIIYCPRFSFLLPNSCTRRMFMIYDSDIGSFLKIIWKTIIYFHIHIELHIVRVCLPYFQIDLIGEFLWF